jgi:hypothetical protein
MPSWEVWLLCVAFIAFHCLTFKISNFVGYAWERLPQGSLVVDVGGGVGAQSFTLAKHHPQLRFIVQDRESVVGDAMEVRAKNQSHTNIQNAYWSQQHWKGIMPEALESGRVRIQGFIGFLLPLGIGKSSHFGFLKRSRLLYTTTCSARGRLRLHALQDNARLV